MNNYPLNYALSEIDERYLILMDSVAEENCRGRKTTSSKKLMRTLLIAALITVLLSITAYAVYSIHAAKQEKLREQLKIEESKTESYVEYDTASQETAGVVLLSTINDGEFQKVYLDISPVEPEIIAGFPDTYNFFWNIEGWEFDGYSPWMIAIPVIETEPPLAVKITEAYDEDSKTLTLECNISNDAILQAKQAENGESIKLTVTLLDSQAMAESGNGSVNEWLSSQKSYGSIRFTPTEQEKRFFNFQNTVYLDKESGREITLVGLDLSPTSAVWQFSYEDDEKISTGENQAQLLPWLQVEDKITNGAKITFADGNSFCTYGALRGYYENEVVNCYCKWEKAININDVESITLGDLTLWQADG